MIGIPTSGVADTSMSGKIGLIRPINRALSIIKAAVVQGQSTDPAQPAKTTTATISNIVFSDSVDSNDRPGKTGTSFPSGTKSIYAFFDYDGFGDGQRFGYQWTINGKDTDPGKMSWDGGTRGNWWVSFSDKQGLDDGTYDVTVSLDGVKLGKARATIGAAAAKPSGTLGAPTFAEGVSNNTPVKPHASSQPFASGIPELYAFFTYKDVKDGTPWTSVWSIDGEEVLRKQRDWTFGASGTAYISISSKSGLPDGRYKLQIYIGDTLATQSETMVGAAGGKAVATDQGVQVMGEIKDRDSDQPIPGAVFVVVKQGVDVQAFFDNPTDEDMLGMGTCDSKGIFVLNTTLQRGETYGVIVAAKGYQPTLGKIQIRPDAESPVLYGLFLQKR